MGKIGHAYSSLNVYESLIIILPQFLQKSREILVCEIYAKKFLVNQIAAFLNQLYL